MSVFLQHYLVETLTLDRVISIDLESYESKASGATRIFFAHDRYIDNLTKLFHVALDIGLSRAIQDTSDEVFHEMRTEINLLVRRFLSLSISAALLLLNNLGQVFLQLLKHICKLTLSLLRSLLRWSSLSLNWWNVITRLSIAGVRRCATGLWARLILLLRLPGLLLGLCRLLRLILLHQEGLYLTKCARRINTTGS
jgi:hypothetical protein